MILGLVNLFATCFSNIFIDRLGRKALLYISDAGMIASLSAFGSYSYAKDQLGYDVPGTSSNNQKNKNNFFSNKKNLLCGKVGFLWSVWSFL